VPSAGGTLNLRTVFCKCERFKRTHEDLPSRMDRMESAPKGLLVVGDKSRLHSLIGKRIASQPSALLQSAIDSIH
jgi:hypothetical protein